jgi:hypothetical protein
MIDHPGERPHERPSMEPEKFGSFLDHLGLTANEAARLWGYDPRKVRNMRAGTQGIPPIVEIMLVNTTALSLLMQMIDRYFSNPEHERPLWFKARMELAAQALTLSTGRPEPKAFTHDEPDDE